MGDGPLVTEEALQGRTLMLFDGLCGLCNDAVLWVIKHDHSDHFRFAPQQSDLAAAILARHGIDREATLASNTVYLVLNAGSKRLMGCLRVIAIGLQVDMKFALCQRKRSE